MKRLSFLVAVGVIAAGSLATPAGATEESAPVSTPVVRPAAPAVIQGTPTQILAETPTLEPLPVGYSPGLFLSPAALKKKDARGCTWRNQMLIALAVKKPKVGAKCTLTGGEWRADFGYSKVNQPSQIRIGKLLPDKYVYAQGAYGWTATQRSAYANSALKPARQTRSTNVGLLEINNYQIFTTKTSRFINLINSTLDQKMLDQRALQVELSALQAKNPGIFANWTVATLLNAKSWGLSLSPGTAGNFAVTLEQCTNLKTYTINNTTYQLINVGKLGRPVSLILKVPNPCTNTFSVPNQAAVYGISVIPMTASSQAPIGNQALSGYAAPIRPPVSRFLFGMHAPADWVSDVATGFNGPILTETIPNVPVGYLRLWDTQTMWRDLEPSPGNWQWRFLDKQIEMAQLLDARVMLVLGGTPAWASTTDGSVTSPPKIDSWRNYVKSVCAKYGSSISAYEVWNEANLTTFWGGTAQQMADLTKAAFEEIRACNPGALVVAANTTSRATGSFGNFYPDYLAALGQLGWPVDAYSVHSYPTASGGANDRLKGIGQFRAMLALAGAPQSRVFDSEINYGLAGLGETRVDITGANAMTLVSRTYIDSVRYDFDSTFWFVWTKSGDNKLGIQFTRNTPSERQAWNVTYDWLVGAQFQRCLETTTGITVCQFNKGTDNFSLVWAGDVGSAPLSTPPGYFTGIGSRVCDLYQSCTAITTATAVAVGPMPMRIDGPALSSGPLSSSAATTSASADAPDAPVITDVDLSYGVSNKADATATWAPPANANSVGVTGYAYTWSYCKGGSCIPMAKGSTGAGTFTARTILNEGPGAYEFQVSARKGDASGPSAQQRVTLLRSDAAPPSDVNVRVRDRTGIVVWSAPDMRSELIQGYEVQILNMSTGVWVPVPGETNSRRVMFTGSPVLDLRDGQSITARVRTVLKTGAKSIWIPSEPLVVTTRLPAPRVISALRGNGTVVMYVAPPDNTSVAAFPAAAYQVRYTVDGTAWTLASFVGDLSGFIGPNSSVSLIPYRVAAVVGPVRGAMTFPAGARYQIQAIDNSGLEPSDWIDFDVTPFPTRS